MEKKARTLTRYEINQFLEKHLELFTGKVVADIGCGKNLWVRENVEPVAERVLYIDKEHTCISTHVWDIEYYPPEEFINAFDVAFLKEVLEHVWNPLLALRNVSRILKRGGLLVITSPFVYRIHGDSDYYRLTNLWYERALRNHFEHIIVDSPDKYAKDLDDKNVPVHYFVTATKRD